jgi:hypothetical protein
LTNSSTDGISRTSTASARPKGKEAVKVDFARGPVLSPETETHSSAHLLQRPQSALGHYAEPPRPSTARGQYADTSNSTPAPPRSHRSPLRHRQSLTNKGTGPDSRTLLLPTIAEDERENSSSSENQAPAAWLGLENGKLPVEDQRWDGGSRLLRGW